MGPSGSRWRLNAAGCRYRRAAGRAKFGGLGFAGTLGELSERVPAARCALPLPVPKWQRRSFIYGNRNREVVQRRQGIAFIIPDDGSDELFVHRSAIVGEGFESLAENAKVQYEFAQGDKGPQTTNVAVLASV